MAKKTKNTEQNTDIVPVLENQIPVRFVATVKMSEWEDLGGGLYNIPVGQFSQHPDNAFIFKTSEKDDDELLKSVQLNGVIVPIIANHRGDELRLISGHRRLEAALRLGHKEIRTEVVQYDDAEEILVLYASNVNRDMHDSAKLRYFKVVRQYLCQNSQDVDAQGDTADEMFESAQKGESPLDEDSLIFGVLNKRGIQVQGRSQYEIIEDLTGFTEYAQKTLIRVCDERYRERVLNKIRGLKNGKKQAEQKKEIWLALENAVLSGDMSLRMVDLEIKKLNKQIDAVLSGKTVKEEKPKVVKAPKKEKIDDTERLQGFAEDFINIEFADDDKKALAGIEKPYLQSLFVRFAMYLETV